MKKNLGLNIGIKDALIITDIQKDFLPGGSLPVREGELIIPVINDYIRVFTAVNAKVVAVRDWHPQNHISFHSQGGPWPSHCVQGTDGAAFDTRLQLPKDALFVFKASDANREEYSVLDGTGLIKILESQGIKRLFIGGLATDYCIVNSVLEARKNSYDVFVLTDAVRGIEATPGDVDRAFLKMQLSGAKQVTLEDLPEPDSLTGIESIEEVAGDEPLGKSDVKKKARMRSRGTYKRVRTEHG